MIEITLHGRNGVRTIQIKPRGFPTRHVRTRQATAPVSPTPPPDPPPVPACPVLAAFHTLQRVIGGNGYFIFDEIFRVVRQEGASITRDVLLETLRSYYRDGKIAFRPGYGSQLQFALRKSAGASDRDGVLSPKGETA